ncbi:MAG: hypothetical protein J0L94_10765 [Rhodothermia bacterium]|nr:hypothetical protein [Rhodothermia bacterium]
MGKERINRRIPKAIELLRGMEVGGTKLNKELTSDISAFGTSIRQSGLLAAICFFIGDSEAGKRRKGLLNILTTLLENPQMTTGDQLLRHAITHPEIEDELLDAAVSVKLAIRVFEKKSST